MLALLVEHGLVLDAAALVAGFHRAEHTAALGDPLELGEYGLLHEAGELLDDVGALDRVLVAGQPPLLVDDHLDGQRATDGVLGRSGHRLVVGVGVQAVAVVVDGAQGLQRGADVVEVHLLGVQGTAGGLDVVLELLRPLGGTVALAQGHRPDPPGHPADDGVLRVQAVGEEERQVRREVVDAHAAGEVGLDVGEAVGEGERDLADRVRPGLRDVVAGDRHGVEVADAVVDEPFLHVGHAAQGELGGEDAGVLPLVLLEDVGLHGAAHGRQRSGPHLGGLGRGGLAALGGGELFQLLVDGDVEEHREDRRSRPVDRHGDARRRRAQVEAGVELLHVVQGRDRDPGRADLAVDVGTGRRVPAVERDRVERRGQPGGLRAPGEVVEAPVGAERVTLAGEHPRRRLADPLEREHPGGEREPAGQVLRAQEAHEITVVADAGQRHPGYRAARQRRAAQRRVDLLAAHLVDQLLAGVLRHRRRPGVQLLAHAGIQRLLGAFEQGVEPRVPVTGGGELLVRRAQVLASAGRLDLLGAVPVVGADGLGDLRQVADAGRREHPRQPRGRLDRHPRQRAGGQWQALGPEQRGQMLVERGDPVVVEPGRARPEHRHVLPGGAEGLPVAHQLTADVAAGVLGPGPLELVDRHHVGEVQHVDLLELGRGTVLGRHHVQRDVHQVDDAGVTLADSRRLDHDQVVAGGLAGRDHVADPFGQLTAGASGCQRTEEDRGRAVGVPEHVHPDAVAEQGAAGAAAGRVHRDHGGAQLVLLVEAQPAQQLVGQRGLAGSARARDAQHRDTGPGRLAHLARELGRGAALQHGDRPGERTLVTSCDRRQRRQVDGQVGVALGDDNIDHPWQPEPLPVLRREDPGDSAGVQQGDLVGDDDTPSPAVHPDVAGAALAQPLDQIAEVLDVPALVGRQRHRLGVLLDRGRDHLLHTAVMAEVDHFDALGLQDPAHDVDRRVVAVEQGGHGDDPHRMLRDVQG